MEKPQPWRLLQPSSWLNRYVTAPGVSANSSPLPIGAPHWDGRKNFLTQPPRNLSPFDPIPRISPEGRE